MLRRPIHNLNPQDVGQPRGIGINVLFNNGDNVFNQTFTTKDQVKSNLINYILTNKGERVLNPNFGSNLRAYLFEGITEANLRALEIKLTNDIQNYFPNVTVDQLTFTPSYEENAITLDFNLSVYNGTPQTVQIIL
jgi:phage baseplate assembly protein W